MGSFNSLKIKFISLFLTLGIYCSQVIAQQSFYSSANDEMYDVMISAGYGALFGTGMGVALLPFLPGSPMDNVRFIAGGASIGFMAGSIYGMYNVYKSKKISPAQQDNGEDYYYSMPPTIPTQGNNSEKKPLQTTAHQQNYNNNKIKFGSLLISQNHSFSLGIPLVIYKDTHTFYINLAHLNF